MNSQHSVNKLMKLVKKQGTKSLLPQNLPEEMLSKMLREAEALDNDNSEEIPSSTIFMAIMLLIDPTFLKKDKIENQQLRGKPFS